MDVIADLAAGDACQTVVAAIVGAAGLDSTLAAARAGKRLLLANKESLVLAGELLMAAARDGGACIVPTDSQHHRNFQCPPAEAPGDLPRSVPPAPGGPFRGPRRPPLAHLPPK